MSHRPVALFVGRPRERQLLHEQLLAVGQGRGGLIQLSGDAGIGKTALARTILSQARQQGLTVLWGSCYEGEGHRPFGPWLEILQQRQGELGEPAFQQKLTAAGQALAHLLARPTSAPAWPRACCAG
jgi:predicted ATPase